MYDSAFAALYYPWIKVENPIGRQRRRRGAHPAVAATSPACGPAPTRPAASGRPRPTTPSAAVLDVERYASPRTSSRVLNPIGINCIRPFGTRGIRIWGARTLASRHRLALHQRPPAVQHGRGDDPRAAPSGRCSSPTTWPCGRASSAPSTRSCAGCGRPARCSASARPGVLRQVRRRDQPAGVDRRRACSIVEVGIAPVKPAEFVVFRISQNKQIAA